MLHLLWGLLNIAVFIFFIVICFRAIKLVREKSGLFASYILVFGLYSFVCRPGDNNSSNEPNAKAVKTWPFASEDSLDKNATFSVNTTLEKTLVSECELFIRYGKDKQGQMNIPINASAEASGFVSGINWIPVSIVVNTTNDNTKFTYDVDGIIEWKLLNVTFYRQEKAYKGSAEIK